jgi:hypothetical protein
VSGLFKRRNTDGKFHPIGVVPSVLPADRGPGIRHALPNPIHAPLRVNVSRIDQQQQQHQDLSPPVLRNAVRRRQNRASRLSEPKCLHGLRT